MTKDLNKNVLQIQYNSLNLPSHIHLMEGYANYYIHHDYGARHYDAAIVLMEVSNTSTLQSGTRPPVIGYTETWKNTVGTWLNNSVKSGPMSMTSQKIVWVDFIKYK